MIGDIQFQFKGNGDWADEWLCVYVKEDGSVSIRNEYLRDSNDPRKTWNDTSIQVDKKHIEQLILLLQKALIE